MRDWWTRYILFLLPRSPIANNTPDETELRCSQPESKELALEVSECRHEVGLPPSEASRLSAQL